MATLMIGLTFIITLLMGIPISFILGITSLIYLAFFGNIPFEVIPQRLAGGLDSYVLLALPFFVLAGKLMNKTGITRDLVKFSGLLVGKLPGALAQINVVVSIIFAGLTGAAVADTAAIGSILIPAMKEEGYSAEYSAAITTASSIIGPIIPPSIIMVIYSSVTGESIGALFMAGIVPGVLIGISLMVMAGYYAIKYNHPRRTENISFKEGIEISKNALLGLIMPIIIIGGIISGIFTATEAAAISVFYALFIGIVVFRNISFKDIFESLRDTAITSSVILIIISTAKLMGLVFSVEMIPQKIAQLVISFTDEKIVFLIIMNLFLLFMGMIMETGANVILLAPILLPLANKFGVHPLHFALILLINVNIGLTTPPLGVCLFTAAPIAKISFEKVAKQVLPLVAMEVVVLLLVTYCPELILFVPRFLGFL